HITTGTALEHAKMGIPTDITLYTAGTPNGIKITILLEELGLEYKIRTLQFSTNEQKAPWFLEINPNGRIPAITDTWTDGSEIRVFESGAVMQYIVDRYDKDHKVSYPSGSKETWEVNSWASLFSLACGVTRCDLHWQMAGLGPMQGQANHFQRYAPEKIEYGINRYVNETRRLYSVMDSHLAKSTSGFLAGDRLSIADIACWAWVAAHAWAEVSLDEFPHVNKWLHALLLRPGFEKGRHIPEPHTAFGFANMTAEEKDKMAEATKTWVQSNMQADAKK
ncbi:hypothetical protein Trco_008047, partial [Trichoderma cornu-damae]